MVHCCPRARTGFINCIYELRNYCTFGNNRFIHMELTRSHMKFTFFYCGVLGALKLSTDHWKSNTAKPRTEYIMKSSKCKQLLWKCEDFKCVWKPTESRLCLTHYDKWLLRLKQSRYAMYEERPLCYRSQSKQYWVIQKQTGNHRHSIWMTINITHRQIYDQHSLPSGVCMTY